MKKYQEIFRQQAAVAYEQWREVYRNAMVFATAKAMFATETWAEFSELFDDLAEWVLGQEKGSNFLRGLRQKPRNHKVLAAVDDVRTFFGSTPELGRLPELLTRLFRGGSKMIPEAA